jgi:hypothetical protein
MRGAGCSYAAIARARDTFSVAHEHATIVKPSRHAPPLLALLASVVVACRARAPASAAAPTRDTWSPMTWEERHDVMTFAVLPNMARAFQRHNGSADPDMTCATCHGADAELVHYAMPHGLPALDPRRLPDPNGPDPREARMAKFMIEEVTPAMADLLGVPLRDRADRDPKARGFSCFNCHPAR